MSVERLHASDDGGDGQDWHPGELRRALQQVQRTLEALNDKVVVRAVYEVEQRGQDNEIRQLANRLVEDRVEHRDALRKESAERESWQAGMVSRMWWLAALALGTLVTLLGLVASIWGTLHK